MTLTEALKILREPAGSAERGPYRVALVCGFTPLHIETFLAARLRRQSGRAVDIQKGLYGDVPGTLASIGGQLHAAAVALEWEDLDPRLGFRGAGAWGPAVLPDILAVVRDTLERIAAAIENLPAAVAVACSLPTLPLPPIFHTPGWQTADVELALERETLEFAARCLRRSGFLLVNRQRLAEDSPAAARFDCKSDLLTGIPYTLAHADRVAAALARLLSPPAPKKGLITDLDDTLWNGLAGEIGPDQVSWDLASHHQLHGLYQKLLASLAEEGVLIGVASKNDADVVRQALARPDILIPPARIFPVEAHWDAKSGSVERILQTWNIAAESVVFVDDSPMELAEVAAAHPGIECLAFPADDPAAGYTFLCRLRDLFGKPRVAEEDALRIESIRHGTVFRKAAAGDGASAEAFLRNAEAAIRLELNRAAADPRALELVNKANQFNLNGRRFTEAEWRATLTRPGALSVTVSYQDKFGQLGKIAVIEARREDDALHVGSWVMSCRAFARRIEHQCLQVLFDRTGARELVLRFAPTPKNGPLRQFLASITGAEPEGRVVITRGQFAAKCPPLYHKVEEVQPGAQSWTQSQSA